MKDSKIKIDIHSLYEILQDNFSIFFLEKVINNFKNIEAKIAIQEFINEFSPVFIYEAYYYLAKNSLIDENNFFRSEKLQRKVKEYRMISTKKTVKSSYIKEIARKMDITFNEDVYDINIIGENNTIKRLNFSEYNKRVDKEFFDSCCLTNIEFFKVLFKEMTKLSEMDYNNIIEVIINNNKRNTNILEKGLSGTRYSYRSSKLFKNTTIQEDDKFFILYRFNILKTIIELKKYFTKSQIVIEINDVLIINLDRFMNKIIAYEIEVLGKDIQSLDTEFINELGIKLDNEMLKNEKEFFHLSRQLRNNIHYNKIDELNNDIYNSIIKLQEKYLNIVYRKIKNCLYFNLDEEDILMNKFFEYCIKNNINQEEIEENYENYYTQFYYNKYINRNL